MKQRGYRAVASRSLVARYVQSSILLSLVSHWLFQSLLYMDRTERRFKLALNVLLTALFVQMAGPTLAHLVLGLLLAHTLNFIFNGQINAVLKNFGYSRTTLEDLMVFLQAFGERASREPSIRYAAAFGSLSRGELSDTSDVDIRVIRRAGLGHALRSCTFVLLERSRALFTGVPLDIYVLDSDVGLSRIRADEPAHILKQTAPDDGGAGNEQ